MKGIQTVKRRINNEESQQAAAETANSTAEAPNQRPGAPKGEAIFSALPKLHDEVPADRPELFKRKLQACCTAFDFNSESDMKAKEAKRQTLLELVEYVNSTRSCFQESLIPDIVKMVASNIFRALPAKDRSSMSLSDPDEEEPVLEKAWPHLQIVYEFFLRFVVSNEVDPKVAKLSLDTNFVSQMLELFDSDDPRERDYVKTITHRIYGKFMALRAFIRRAIQNTFFKVMYECEMHNGVGELLEILGSIINGFALPLKEEHKDFLVRALIPLHKMKFLASFHQQLSYCMSQYVEKDPRLAYVIITSMLRYWPATITSKQVLFLNELEELLELTKPPEFIRLQDQLFQRLASCITCPHFQVAERTLFLWNNDYIVRLITSSRKVLFPVVIGALYMNSKQHWNSAVHGLTFNVLKLLMEADPQLFDECSANHKEAYDEEEQREAARQQKWARLQELFDKRHTAADRPQSILTEKHFLDVRRQIFTTALAAVLRAPKLSLESILADLEGAEESAFGSAFTSIAKGQEALQPDDIQLRSFIESHSLDPRTSGAVQDVDTELLKIASTNEAFAIGRDAFVMLLRMNPVNESEALESFLRLAAGGVSENITAEDCRTGLFQLLQNIGESLIGDTSERIIDTVMEASDFEMPVCGAGKADTALHRHARFLAQQKPVDFKASLPLHFPMYTLPLAQLMELTEVEPHEVLQSKGLLVEFEESLGRAAFVSHQWVGKKHPDPEFKQLRVLQDALEYAMADMRHISLDLNTEFLVPGVECLDTRVLRERSLFIWYDYFSCPQLDFHARKAVLQEGFGQQSQLASAIASIPAYVGRCSFFFALCPVVYNPNRSMVFTPTSWSGRGWCRAERVFRELSTESSWIMVKSRTELELIATPAASIGGSPGEGTFTVDEDRLQLSPVVLQSVKHRLLLYLQNEDLVGYRVCLNLQTVFLRGLPANPVGDLIPGFDEANVDSGYLAVSRFLYQNGFSAVGDVDGQGWSPLHYGALAGDPVLLRSLLENRAQLDRLTKKPQPQAGVPPRTSALSICLMFKHNEAARILLAAKAQVGSGIQPPISLAAMANNPTGIRILCEAGCKPDMKDILGFSAFDAACGAGSLEAMQELLTQAEYRIDLARSFFASMSNRGGKAELVELLITLRADMNTPFKQRLLSIHGILFAVKSLQYRLGRHTILTRLAYHGHGATPLMFAVMTGQYEGAAALLAAGASSDARNARNRSVADFAREQSLPVFLREALEGRTEEARELVAVAIASNTFHI
ncbi:B'ETA [Symbiodinium sp. KB8]|nr:B'ETA [Symbiodinium sp. KB8]